MVECQVLRVQFVFICKYHKHFITRWLCTVGYIPGSNHSYGDQRPLQSKFLMGLIFNGHIHWNNWDWSCWSLVLCRPVHAESH